MTTRGKHGGTRPGAGRPASGTARDATVRVQSSTLARWQRHATARGVSIDQALSDLLDAHGPDDEELRLAAFGRAVLDAARRNGL